MTGLKRWGDRRCLKAIKYFKARFFPNARPCIEEPGFDIDARDSKALKNRRHVKLRRHRD